MSLHGLHEVVEDSIAGLSSSVTEKIVEKEVDVKSTQQGPAVNCLQGARGVFEPERYSRELTGCWMDRGDDSKVELFESQGSPAC